MSSGAAHGTRSDRLSVRCCTVDILELLPSFERSLRARNPAPRTIQSYSQAVTPFGRFLAAHDLPTDVEVTGRQHVEAFIADQLARRTAASAANRYKSRQQLFKWAEDEDQTPNNPMARMSPPEVVDQPVPVVPDADIVAMLRSCEAGTSPSCETTP